MKILNYFNFYGSVPTLNINGKKKIHTMLGLVSSALSLILTLVSTWLIGKDLIYKAEPLSYNQEVTSQNYKTVTINSQQFPFALVLGNKVTYILYDENFLNITLNYYNMENNSEGRPEIKNITFFKFRFCELKDFPSMDKESFVRNGFQTYYCLDYGNMTGFNLQGYWGEESLSLLQVRVAKCDYDLFPDFCHSKAEIDEYISSNAINFGVMSLDYDIDVSNFTSPLKYYLSYPYFFFSNDQKVINFELETNEISTDKGLIFRDIYLTSYKRLFMKQSGDITLYNEVDKGILSANFYSSNKKKITYRKYIKIPEIIASVGGIFKFISVLFEYINRPFNLLIWNCEIIELLFSKQEDNKIDEKEINNTNKIVSSANFIAPDGINKIALHNIKSKSKNFNDSNLYKKIKISIVPN
jgi:hypothetical protein